MRSASCAALLPSQVHTLTALLFTLAQADVDLQGSVGRAGRRACAARR
jgi:hypothetical protein